MGASASHSTQVLNITYRARPVIKLSSVRNTAAARVFLLTTLAQPNINNVSIVGCILLSMEILLLVLQFDVRRSQATAVCVAICKGASRSVV